MLFDGVFSVVDVEHMLVVGGILSALEDLQELIVSATPARVTEEVPGSWQNKTQVMS